MYIDIQYWYNFMCRFAAYIRLRRLLGGKLVLERVECRFSLLILEVNVVQAADDKHQ